MSSKDLSSVTVLGKYSQYNAEKKRRENFDEIIDRQSDMHETFYKDIKGIKKYIDITREAQKKQLCLGSQRASQFGGEKILERNILIYNCGATPVCYPDAIHKIMFCLLGGVGVGFSVIKKYIDMLPGIETPNPKKVIKFTPRDSKEGWADCLKVLMKSYFKTQEGHDESKWFGKTVEFDLSQIRKKGSKIRGLVHTAPGPGILRNSLENARKLINTRLSEGLTRLRPVDVYDIIMYASEAVLSGGIRRSASICLFSPDDQDMLTAKTDVYDEDGNFVSSWRDENPQRQCSNNSVLLLRNKTSLKDFKAIIEHTKQYGEPGFLWADSEDTLFNPCVEACLYGFDDEGNPGFQFCNLCEINAKKCSTPEIFYEACRAASIIGTLQAGYTNFPYLGKVTKKIVEREALLGISMTGILESLPVLQNEDVLRKGNQIIADTNKEVAKLIGINPAARRTCVKPAGTTSMTLQTTSGIHPAHAPRYFRRVTATKNDKLSQFFKKHAPNHVEECLRNKNNYQLVFPYQPNEGTLFRDDINGVDFLKLTKFFQEHWVMNGTDEKRCVKPFLAHNISNTTTVKDGDWDAVSEYIYKNRRYFSGISLFSYLGEKAYPAPPEERVLTREQYSKKYGFDVDSKILGPIFKAISIYKNIYTARNAVIKYNRGQEEQKEENSSMPILEFIARDNWISWATKKHKNPYFICDAYNIYKWELLSKTKPIPWKEFLEDQDNTKPKLAQLACAGGNCQYDPNP